MVSLERQLHWTTVKTFRCTYSAFSSNHHPSLGRFLSNGCIAARNLGDRLDNGGSVFSLSQNHGDEDEKLLFSVGSCGGVFLNPSKFVLLLEAVICAPSVLHLFGDGKE